jgi:anaerobic C4-dicarboxylate transporter DcuA
MATAIILIQLALVLALIFIGARVGGIGLGIYGMVGVFILVFVFGLKPGNLPIDVMLLYQSSRQPPLCRQQADWIIW